MAKILEGGKTYCIVAIQTISFADLELTADNVNNIFRVEGDLYDWKPNRAINGITGFEQGLGYFINTGVDGVDLTGIAYEFGVIPPLEKLPTPIFADPTVGYDAFLQTLENMQEGAEVSWTVNGEEETEQTGEELQKDGLTPLTAYAITAQYTKDGFLPSDIAETIITTQEAPDPVEDMLTKGETLALSQPMSWTAHPSADYYQVQRSSTNDFLDPYVLWTGKELSFKDKSVMPTETYFWRVVPLKAGVTIAASNVISATTPALTGNVYEIGNGTGEISIDDGFWPNGAPGPVTLQSGDTVLIVGGNYWGIYIENLNIIGDEPLLIRPKNNIVELNGNNYVAQISNTSNVRLTGLGTSNEYGIQFKNNANKALQLGVCKNIIIDKVSFDAVEDAIISYSYGTGAILYNAADPETYLENIQILDVLVNNNCGQISLGGDINPTGWLGVMMGLEIARLRAIDNATCSNMIYLSSVVGYNIHDCYFEGLNVSNTNRHDGILFAKSTGKFYSNFGKGCLCNMARFWPRKLSNEAATVEAFNNIYYDSLRYGMFEFQLKQEEYEYSPTPFYPVDPILVQNNTGGLLGKNHIADGFSGYKATIVDNYSNEYYGDINMNNNLLFTTFNDNPAFTQYGDVAIGSQENNIYSSTQAGAVEDVINFVSIHEGVGASI